jgi:hypothetical protein
MTPNTAAALRALETEIRTYDPFGPAKHNFQDWSDRLAAVLSDLDTEIRTKGTQEGAGIKSSVPEIPENPAKTEDGFFVYDPDGFVEFFDTANAAREYAEKILGQCEAQAPDGWPDNVEQICWGAVLGRIVETERRPVEPGDACEGCDEYVSYELQDCDVPAEPRAAAVPAGGDAVAWRYRYRLVATHKWSKWEFIDEHGNAKLRRMLRDELTTPELCEVESLYRAPAPKGVVTEARKPDGYAYRYETYDGQVIRFNGGIEVNGGKPIEAIPYYFGTPPAAQAQDAGPMARHWREAIDELCDGRTQVEPPLDEIEQRARALATCPDYEVSELAKSKGWTEDAKDAPRFGWLEYGKTFDEFMKQGLAETGTAIYVGDEKILIGDVNGIGGSCDCCAGVGRGNIVSHYWPDARASELK